MFKDNKSTYPRTVVSKSAKLSNIREGLRLSCEGSRLFLSWLGRSWPRQPTAAMQLKSEDSDPMERFNWPLPPDSHHVSRGSGDKARPVVAMACQICAEGRPTPSILMCSPVGRLAVYLNRNDGGRRRQLSNGQ